MIAMWWMGILYKACSVYKCHDENQLYGILVLEESYFMINFGGGIKYGIILENLEPLAGRKTEPVTTIPSPIFGIPIIWIH